MTGTLRNTVDELRTSLSAHADALTDDALADDAPLGRKAALQRRIRRARNQRRAGIAGGVAAVVLVAGGVVATVSQPSRHSSSPEIAGHTMERTVTVTGFDYRLTQTGQSTPGQQRFTFHLPEVGPDRVIELLGTGLGDGWATLEDQDAALARVSGASTAGAPVPVDSTKHDVTVVLRDTRRDAQVGIAVYERDRSLPAGIDDGTAVFRTSVGSDSLLGGTWAAPGRSAVSFTVTGPAERWRVSGSCALPGAKPSRDVMLDEVVDGKSFAAIGCEPLAARSLDPGTAGSQPSRWPLTTGPHTVTVRLVDRGGHPVQVAGAVIGGAIYAVGQQRTVRGMPVDYEVPANGRVWLLDQAIPADNAEITGPAYVEAVLGRGDWRPTAQHLTDGDRDMELAGDDNRAGGASLAGLGEVLAGSTYRFWLEHGKDPAAKATILVYRPLG